MKNSSSAQGSGETLAPFSWAHLTYILCLACVLVAGAWYEAIRTPSLLNPAIWLHLRTGEWILQNHAVPYKALFTQHSDLSWVVPSWGFDLLAALAARLFELRAIPLLVMAFKTTLAIATFVFVRRRTKNYWLATGLTALVQYILLEFPPEPTMMSASFFAIELHFLLESRTSNSSRPLRWLPLLFLLWANFDVQFIYGLLALGLYVTIVLVEAGMQRIGVYGSPKQISPANIVTFGVLSALATLFTPYTYRPYVSVAQTTMGSVGTSLIDSLHSMNFRQPQHYALLLLTMAAFFTLGRQKPLDWFKISMIATCSAYAFRQQQNMWFVALPAAVIVAEGLNRKTVNAVTERVRYTPVSNALVLAALTILLFALAIMRLPTQRALFSKVAGSFPVKAADNIRQNQLPGPLYNTYDWGSFLVWYLPEYPVFIDSRREMYGQAINNLYFETATGLLPLEDDPAYVSSRTFLLKRESRLGEVITHLPDFKTLYRDDLAVVLVRQADGLK